MTSPSGRREAKRWSSTMYSIVILGVMTSQYGTGLFGSLTNSSKLASVAVLLGGANCKLPDSRTKSCFNSVFFGGQLSKVRQTFEPVSKTVASAGEEKSLSLRYFSKNGSSMCSR